MTPHARPRVLAAALLAVNSMALAAPVEHSIPNITVIGVREEDSGRELLSIDEQVVGPAVDGADLLRRVNGLSLGRFGGRGLEPTLRGQSESRINVLLDGSYIHGGCPNRMDPPTSFAAVNSFERVVVLKGVQTLRHGGGGSGGTLLFERDNEPVRQGLSGKLAAGSSSNGLRHDLSLEASWSGEVGYASLRLQDRAADNYDDGGGREVRSAWHENSSYLALGAKLRRSDRLELVHERTDTEGSLYPGAGMDAPADGSEQWRLRYRAEAIGPFSTLSADAYRSDVRHLMDNYSERPLTVPVALRVPSASDTWGGRLVAQGESHYLGNWTAGLDHQHNQRQATRFMGPAPGQVDTVNAYLWPDARIAQSGAFAETEYPLASGTRLRVGLRYDHVRAEARDADADPPSPMLAGPAALYARYYGVDYDAPQREHNWSGLLRVEQGFGEHWQLFAGLSRTLRTADASERFLAAGNSNPMMRWVGNPELAPEQHHQLDVGALGRIAAHALEVVLFNDRVADYILRDRAHGQTGVLRSDNASIYRNIDARILGLEISWDWQFSPRWHSSVDLAWVRSDNRSDERPIAQIPPLNGALSLGYRNGAVEAGAELRWSDRQHRVDDNPMTGSGLDAGETPGWGVINLDGRWRFRDRGELRAGINNLFDRRYAEHLSRGNRDPFYPEPLRINEPGRTLYAGVSYRF